MLSSENTNYHSDNSKFTYYSLGVMYSKINGSLSIWWGEEIIPS